ncbi:hypothetical protein M902_1083 [Bacteriovorax sp. BAL6_X]|uniref:hypothetical protein n=1 Tax=Bacteriovorax sp. BAL6_X TaxID=1201290 RepID=UPI0003860D90|nr:hypothetical protein [Bacteriovorax sp. BAL6_X]EPZ49459.1 hypothetical protein M902_1083 [Bacteriovorax sp. BAL6_X]
MKGLKSFLLFILLSTAVSAQTDFLSKSEAKEINKYMDDICMDTYCGGEINWYTQGMNCSGDKCTISYKAYTWNNAADSFDADLLKALSGKPKQFRSLNSSLKFENYQLESKQRASVNITCTLFGLNNEALAEYDNDKQEYLYTTILESCIDPVESLILDY